MNDLIVFALRDEAPNLFNKYRNVFCIGIGKVNAAINVSNLISTYNPKRVINLGTAGGITLSSGIHRVNNVIQHDVNLLPMGLQPGQRILGQKVDYVFIGSCTNSRMEDLRKVAAFVKGRKKAPDVEVWVVPGSKQVEKAAREEGIDRVFEEAGFRLRQPGCSACLGMNEDKIPAGKYCVSTSNRNFEGRQGPNARTLLASPLTAALAAITGEVGDIREHL
jgi:3-isopropylmalate/(R)-2-methylmalate dehydratase large subunit